MNRAARSLRRALLALACLAALPCVRAAAHDGPPYPIFVDEDLSGWTLSIWCDPDVGTGTFYYYLDAPEGRAVDEVEVHVSSSPADGLAPAVRGTSEASREGEPFQLIGTLEFAHRGTWPTHFVLRTRVRDSGGSQELGHLDYDLDVTPPGLGRFDVLLYATPFLVVAAFWLRIFLAQRAHDRRPPTPSPDLS